MLKSGFFPKKGINLRVIIALLFYEQRLIELTSGLMEEFKEVKEKQSEFCEFCAKKIGNSKWQKRHQLINIDQEPSIRFFCSQQCKLKWIFTSS